MGGFIVPIIDGCIPLWIPLFSCVQPLVVSWQEELSLFVQKPSSSRKHRNFLQKDYLCLLCYYVGLQRRDCTHSLIDCFIWRSKRSEIQLRLDLKVFWSSSKRNNYYASCPIMSLFDNNYIILHGPSPLQTKEQSCIDQCQ